MTPPDQHGAGGSSRTATEKGQRQQELEVVRSATLAGLDPPAGAWPSSSPLPSGCMVLSGTAAVPTSAPPAISAIRIVRRADFLIFYLLVHTTADGPRQAERRHHHARERG
ncbi:MAG TPA: hypothetical protein VE645_17155 [Pseudonocardiaceae bacterium]|nr:hypothetical protein [Pseudonocardiaceae bacterium]